MDASLITMMFLLALATVIILAQRYKIDGLQDRIQRIEGGDHTI